MKLDYKNTLASLHAEFKRLEQERSRLLSEVARLDERIKAVTAAYDALTPVIEERVLEPPSVGQEAQKFDITAGIREILREKIRPYNSLSNLEGMSAPAIRKRLIERGWNADQYDNPSAVVHTILKRLVASDEVERREIEGRLLYAAILSESEKDAIRAAEEDRKKRAQEADLERRRHNDLLQEKRRETTPVLVRFCREIFRTSNSDLSMEQMEDALAERQIDTSCYSSPSSALMVAFRIVGIRKLSNGLWNYKADPSN